MSEALISTIRTDGGTQMRAALDDAVVAEYTQAIREGTDFAPVVLFHDGSAYWLADGFHRFHAYRGAGAETIPAEVRPGTKRDAILYAAGANASHGLRRSNADKRKAVETLLADAEWSVWSDREIARRAGVSDRFVNALRAERSSANGSQMTTTKTVERNGTTYQQNTAAIGSARPPVSASAMSAADRAEQTAERRALQAEHDRQREEARAQLPERITQNIAAREAAIAARRGEAEDAEGLTNEDRIAELDEAVRTLEAENARLVDENRLYGEMRAEWQKGGFEAVIAGRDETIRVLKTRVETESADKASWMRSANHWKEQARKLGYSRDMVIDVATGETVNGH